MPQKTVTHSEGWFNSQRLATKLRTVFAVQAALSVLIAVISWPGLLWLVGNASDYQAASRDVVAVAGVRADLSVAYTHAENFLRMRRPTNLDSARKSIESAHAGVDKLLAAARAETLPDTAAIEELDRAIDRLDGAIVSLRALKPSASEAEVTAAAAGLSASGMELYKTLKAVGAKADQRMQAFGTDGTLGLYWIIALTGVLGAAAIINARSAMKRTRDEISKPLEDMAAAMVRLAEGDNEITVEGADRTDEIGDMARSVEVFRRGYLKLDRMRAEIAEKAREREAMREEQARLLLGFADNFERTVGDVVGGVAAASSQLQLTASSMAAAAEQAAQQTGEVSAAMNEASAGVTAAAAASDEFAMSIGEISRQAATSAELARTASVAAADADTTISALTQSAHQVGQIVELISTIAQRTNLLALNASIEAARGGEAGRGFAVVASEVKELAAQTSKATEEVAQQIRAIQESTGASVAALRAIGKQVEQLEATSVSIAAAVDQQSVAGQDLARSIDLAARSADDVSSNIVHVRQTSLATGAAASQVLNSSTELEQQAATLKSQVQEFLSHVRAA